MGVEVEVTVDAPKSVVWRLVSDIENSESVISAIEKIEVHERPGPGILGLKWTETRTMFGKSATETMTITEVGDDSWYVAEAQSHGAVYRTRVSVQEQNGATRLHMAFDARAMSVGAKIMSAVFGVFVKGATRKALLRDLEDLKAAAERQVS